MLVVAGLSLKNLQPRVWDPCSPFFLSDLRAVMVSYADFDQMPVRRRKAMELGLRRYLGVPDGVKIFLDNGAFYFLQRKGEVPVAAYEEFVREANPDWWPIPRDYIPTPAMPVAQQRQYLIQTMDVNLLYQHDGFVPVMHVGAMIDDYIAAFLEHDQLMAKPSLGLGGIVPNLLRAPRALPYRQILDGLRRVRTVFHDKLIHVFGIGGIATLHLTALLGIDSVDSAGWRNRAARGIVQLPGRGERMVANLGSWRGRTPDDREWQMLADCRCPACTVSGVDGLKASGIQGFCHRATHNLWTLLQEERQIREHLRAGTYQMWYRQHVNNSVYRPLIDALLTDSAGER